MALIAATLPSLLDTVDLVLVTHPTATSATSGSNWRRITIRNVSPTDQPCIGSFCLPFGAQGAELRDVWSDGDTIVMVGWQVPSGASTKSALILVRRLL